MDERNHRVDQVRPEKALDWRSKIQSFQHILDIYVLRTSTLEEIKKMESLQDRLLSFKKRFLSEPATAGREKLKQALKQYETELYKTVRELS